MKKQKYRYRNQLFVWEAEAGDLESLEGRLAGRLLFDVLLINRFELALLDLKKDDCVWGPVHSSVGQEAVAAGAIHALRKTDKVTGTHRAHHQFVAKVLHYVMPDDWDPREDALGAAGEEVVRRAMAEIMGLAPGYCGGRGGSMHLRCAEAGFMGSNAIVAGGIPPSMGMAFAEKRRGTGAVVVSFFGDGATNQGAFHEAANLAGLWNLPVILFIENNLYAVGTRADKACAVSDLALRAVSYDMEGHIVDGNDIVAVYESVRDAADRIRAGGRPCLIEARCYRRYHHAQHLPGSAFKYRTKEEEDAWAQKEVTACLPEALTAAGVLDEKTVRRIAGMAESAVAQAVAFCTEGGNPPKVRAELWPNPETLCEGLRSDGQEFEDVTFRECGDFSEFEDMRYSDAIAAATGRWLEKDPEAFVLGEEVANMGGGAYGATRNLPPKYPDRVLNTPISEAGFAGLALGAALVGMRPVVEIMFPDFTLVGADQLFNQIAKARHMYGNTADVPLVARTRIATGCGYGAQHSMHPTRLYDAFPGWRIVAPSNAFDYIGLFNSAMTSLDPVIFLEHHTLYGEKFPVPKGDLDYFVAMDKARVVAEGTDATVIAYSSLAGRCERLLDLWAAEGVSAEIIDLRTIDSLGTDYGTLGASLKKTGAAVIVEEAPTSLSIGGRIAAELTERFFDYLDGPVARLTSADVANPVSRALEAAAMIGDDAITAGVVAVARRQWK